MSLGVALGCGLLIGIERERRKGSGRRRAFAGVRSFAVTALGGGLAELSGEIWLVAAGAILVVGLTAISYLRTARSDPGVTTEIALFVTYCLGVTAIARPAIASAAAVAVAALLAARSRLHRFSTELLSEAELNDALVFAAAALIVLPLVPDAPVALLGDVNPRRLWLVVVLLLGLQALGHVAVRLVGPRVGLAAAGVASGFASSTATFSAMGRRWRTHVDERDGCVAGALASCLSTVAQIAVILATVSPALLAISWPYWAASLAVTLTAALHFTRRQSALRAPAPSGRALDLVNSFAFAALLTGVTALTTWIASRFGDTAARYVAVVAAFADVHSASASIGVLAGDLPEDARAMLVPLFAAFSANAGSKIVAAAVMGGMGFALRVAPAVAAGVAPLWLGLVLTR